MADITHTIFIDAPSDRVYRALTRSNELSRWWCRCEGDTAEGGEATFMCEDTASVRVRVQKLVPKLVSWRCIDHDFHGNIEWLGTTIEFVLWPRQSGTQVVFSHMGFADENGLYPYCQVGWWHYLKRIKSLIERGFADYSAGTSGLSDKLLRFIN